MSSDNQYFDLTTTGVGFINRFRLNKPTNGHPYYSVTIAALRGKLNDEGKSQKTYIDCNIVGDATVMAKQLAVHFERNADASVMVRFVAGDLEQRKFEYKSGERKGQTGYALKARLFDIKWFKIDGNTFYSEAERQRHAEQKSDSASADDGTQTPETDGHTVDAAPTSPATVGDGTAELPCEVRLDKDDPYFDERRQQLREQGYRWDSETSLWRLSQAA